MAFTVQDFHDLVNLLAQHPEWRSELRRLVLSEELLELPRMVQELSSGLDRLAEAQRRTEERLEALAEAQRRANERMDRLEAAVAALVEAQRRTEERLEALAEAQRRTEARLETLAEAQRRTEARLEALAEAQRRTEERLEALAEAQRRANERMDRLEAAVAALVEAQRRTEKRLEALAEAQRRTEKQVAALTRDVARLKGTDLARTYRERAHAYFGSLLLGLRVLPQEEVDRLVEPALQDGRLTWDERQDILRADLVARGHLRTTGEEAYLAVEVSWVVDRRDVERAHRRARALEKVTGRVLPAVAGVSIIPEARALAQQLAVVQVTDGSLDESSEDG